MVSLQQQAQLPDDVAHTSTGKEIFNQPHLWRSVVNQFLEEREAIKHYLARFLAHTNGQILLTGAGSSAFIGNAVAPVWRRRWRYPVYDVPTTDIVTHPANFFSGNIPTLLLSFARSGNSPESIHTVTLAEKLVDSVYHLIITCNAEGALAHQKHLKHHYTFVLPPESNDKALAMTGSFTGMALTGILLGDIFMERLNEELLFSLYQAGEKLLSDFTPLLREIAHQPFKRAVFLGAGPLLGIARESHLKLQELTDGQIMCQFDSFLGFRHGPRAVANEETLLVYLLSPDAYVRQYEMDLIREIADLQLGSYRLAITQHPVPNQWVDYQVVIPVSLPEILWGLVAVLPAQILGLFKSIHLGLSPDNPSRRGAISRVVQGVQLYEFQPVGR